MTKVHTCSNCRIFIKIILLVIIVALLISTAFPCAFAESNQIEELNINLVVGDNKVSGYAINASYPYNTYLSLRTLAEALSETDKKFDIEFLSTEADGDYFNITTGKKYNHVDRKVEAKKNDEEDSPLFLDRGTYRLFVDGSEKKYYTYRYSEPKDLFMSLTDIQLLFDLGAEFTGANEITIHPERTFSCNIEGLRQEGYFDQMNSALVGTSKDGKILFSTNQDISYPVASTSKLMSYLIIKDAIKEGKIKLSDTVTISSNTEKLSKDEDGRIKMKAGQTSSVSELIDAMLVVSSNEAALALAEYVSGSEYAFVKLMNEKAKELKLDNSVFYNCSGLPLMTCGTIPTKLQNKMSSKDLFSLVCHILNEYPEVTDITSKQLVKIESFDYTSWNSNTLIFNNSDVTGLKTGSSIASGSCVVACDRNDKIVIILGAEDSAVRGRAAEILLKMQNNVNISH